MKQKLYIYKYEKNHLWIKIDSGWLKNWQEEAEYVLPNNSTAQKHYVHMAILVMLLYQGNHSMTYHNTYITSGVYKAITNKYNDVLAKHRSVVRTNNNGKPKYENRHICGYTIEEPMTKQDKIVTYTISGTGKLFESFCLSVIETLESENGTMLCSTLEDVVRNIFEVKSTKKLKDICEDILQCKNNKQKHYKQQLEELTTPIDFNPNSTFEERYSYLYWDKKILKLSIKNKHLSTVLSYLKHQSASHKEEERYLNEEDYNENRYYHAFHRTPKGLRESVMLNGDRLVEAFDVHQCFYVLMCKLLEKCNDIDYDELMKYEILVGYGDLYTTILRYLRTEPEYANNKMLSLDTKTARNYIKEEIQRWRNMLPKRVEGQKGIIEGIDMFYKTYFPTIRDFILNYHTERQQKKKNNCKVKQLQCDCIKIETEIMSHRVCERLEQYGVYAITLHDGVYIRNCDKEMLDSIGVNIETIFWQELNLFIDQPQLQQAA